MRQAHACKFESILPWMQAPLQSLDKEATEETKMQMLRFTHRVPCGQHDKGLANNMVILRSEASNS